MELLDSIKNRRSIRCFSDAPVPQEIVRELLSAAIEAPSPKNAQPWHFVVFSGSKQKELMGEIKQIVDAELDHGRILPCIKSSVLAMETAPLTILVFNRATQRYAKEPFPIIARSIDVQSIGACIQNLLLAACEKGLGTLWVCDLLDVQPVLKNLESDEELVAAIALGYPAIAPHRPRRLPLDDVVTWRAD